MNHKKILLTLTGVLFAASMVAQAELTHRYSFTGDLTDSVGGADGVASGATTINEDSVTFAGGWIDLPGSDIAINTYSEITVEFWSTQGTTDQGYSHTVSFGDTWENGTGKDYFAVSTSRGNQVVWAAIAAPTPDETNPWEDETGTGAGPERNDDMQHHYSTTIDGTSITLYIDGVQVGTPGDIVAGGDSLASVATNFALVGKGVYTGDATWNGSINELRIWDNAMTAEEVLNYALAGPDDITGDPGTIASQVVSITETNLFTSESGQATLTVTYSKGGVLELTEDPGLEWVSSDTNVLTVASNGVYSAVGDGDATVSAIFAGETTASVSINVDTSPLELGDFTPTGWVTVNNPTIEQMVTELAATVQSVVMKVDVSDVTPTITGSGDVVISYDASDLADGEHTVHVEVYGSPTGAYTNEWTFGVFTDADKPTEPVYHWDFEEGTGTDIIDSVSGSNGVVIGTNYEWVDGGISLDGGGVCSDWNDGTNDTGGAYVDLPNGILSSLSDAWTIEVTFERTSNQNWSRVWDFGTSSAGEDQSENGAANTFLSTTIENQASRLRHEIALSAPGYNNRLLQNDDPNTFADGELMHAVVVYDSQAQRSALYVNGELADANTGFTPLNFTTVTDNNNWLGRSQYSGDAMYDGKIYDLRIYNGIMNADEVLARYEEVGGGGAPTVPPVIDYITIDGDQVSLGVTTEDKGTYSVLRKTNLGEATWTEVLSGLPAGTITTNVTSSGADQEFYSVKGE